MCLALTALHCFTRCDTIRAFARRGIITPLKVLEKFSEFMDVSGGLGGNVTCSVKVCTGPLQTFYTYAIFAEVFAIPYGERTSF